VIPTWFLYVTGFSMVILGALQVQQRPRGRGDSLYQRFVNIGTLWSLCCIVVGLGLLAMALGYWTGPLPQPTRPHQPPHRRSAAE
jgi:hypothetical protein